MSIDSGSFNTNQEMIMSQSAHEKPDPEATPTPEQKQPELPISGVSPDDPFPIDPKGGGGTSKPGQPQQ